MKVRELSVFFPAYNEEKNIAAVVDEAKNYLEKNFRNWEIIIVDDGSKDRTGEIADNLAKEDRRIRVIHHSPNRGYGGALKSGFKAAKYEWIAFMDSDRQFKFSEIDKFIKKEEESGADLVLGVRVHRADPLARKLFTFVWAKILPRLLFGLRVSDYSCGFKMLRKKVYEATQPLIGEEKVTQIEMLVKAQRLGFAFAEVGVRHYPRKFGKQTGANLGVVLRSFRDLLKLWWQLR